MYYVITDNSRLVDNSPSAYTQTELQQIADRNNIGVYVITGERTGQTADPQTEFNSLRIVHVDGATVWATTEDSLNGWRSLYRCQVGQPFEPVGDNVAGIPADVPQCVQAAMWGKGGSGDDDGDEPDTGSFGYIEM